MSDVLASLAASLALPSHRPILPGETTFPALPVPLEPAPILPFLTVPTDGGASLTIGRGTLTRQDGHLFGGTAAPVALGMTDDQILDSIGCNFRAEVEPALYRHDGDIVESSETTIWKRSDNGNQLGSFGNRRAPIQPTDYLESFRRFVSASDGILSLDVVGSIKGGRTLYFASKLAGRNVTPYAEENRVGDVTSQWLVVTDYYGESRKPKAILLSNQLICCNGMSESIETKFSLSHTRSFDVDSIAEILHAAASQSTAYIQAMDMLVERRINLSQGEEIIRSFYAKEEKIANKIVSIYRHNLIGGELPERQNTGWRVMSAVTQYNSHERIGRPEVAFGSQLDGPRANSVRQFSRHLLEVTA